MAAYQQTSCSQCGASFGPGEHGFSHCDQHQTPEVWIPELIRNHFDKAPSHYSAMDTWDDGADDIARKIIERFAERNRELVEASRAVVARWDTPNWKEAEPTGRFIARLRTAIERCPALTQPPHPASTPSP